MISWTPTRQLVKSLGGAAVSLLLILVLLSGSLCAVPICAMPAVNASKGCAGLDMPKAPVSVSAVSIPGCCQISQVPPARTSQQAALQSSERNLLPVAGTPTATASFVRARSVSQRIVLSPPVDRQSVLSVFLI
jgi:hypothetical protein